MSKLYKSSPSNFVFNKVREVGLKDNMIYFEIWKQTIFVNTFYHQYDNLASNGHILE